MDGERPCTSRDMEDDDDPDDLSEPLSSTAVEPGIEITSILCPMYTPLIEKHI